MIIIRKISKNNTFIALLTEFDASKIAIGKDFDKESGSISKSNILTLDQDRADKLAKKFSTLKWTVEKVEQKPVTQNPYPPFITSTLQQEGIRKLRMSSQQVMRTAQHLYEEGYITYMRTDSVSLSNEAIQASRDAIGSRYGNEYLPKKPRVFKNKVF